MGFDRKENFRSSFKEDRKPNEAPKKCRKQGEEAHGCAPGSTTMLQLPGPRTSVRQTMRPGTAVSCPQSRAVCFFLRLFRIFLHFLGLPSLLLGAL